MAEAFKEIASEALATREPGAMRAEGTEEEGWGLDESSIGEGRTHDRGVQEAELDSARVGEARDMGTQPLTKTVQVVGNDGENAPGVVTATGVAKAPTSAPMVPHQRSPPPGLNPATIAEDIARLQAIQEEMEEARRVEATRALEPTDGGQRRQEADRDGEDQEVGGATVTAAASTATASSLAVEGAVYLSKGTDDEK